MQIIKIVIMAICLICGGMAVYYYLKIRRLLHEHSEEEPDKVMPEMQSRMKQLSAVLYVLVPLAAIYWVVLIIELIVKNI